MIILLLPVLVVASFPGMDSVFWSWEDTLDEVFPCWELRLKFKLMFYRTYFISNSFMYVV